MSDSVLDSEVFLELIVILDDLVPSALQTMDERTGTFGFLCVTLGIRQIVRTILARAKRTLQSVTITHLESIETLNN